MENAITDFLDAIIPDLDKMLSDMRFWIGFAMLAGPIILIVLGLFYFFLAPKEANHRMGYRTYFGMGSVPAWRFTQRLAGMVWGGLGIVLCIVALIASGSLSEVPAEAMSSALTIMIVEGVGAILALLGIEITLLVRYDMNGNRRFRKRKS